jgi:hypothetical protein
MAQGSFASFTQAPYPKGNWNENSSRERSTIPSNTTGNRGRLAACPKSLDCEQARCEFWAGLDQGLAARSAGRIVGDGGFWARSRDLFRFKPRTKAESYRCRRLADYIIATSESPPDPMETIVSGQNSWRLFVCPAHEVPVFLSILANGATVRANPAENSFLWTSSRADLASDRVFGRDNNLSSRLHGHEWSFWKEYVNLKMIRVPSYGSVARVNACS